MKAWWSIATGLGGAAIMWFALGGGTAAPTSERSSSSPSPTNATRVNVVNHHAGAGSASFDVATLRAAIRDELAATDEARSAAAEPPSEPTAEQVVAAEAANQVLDNAVAVGRWTSADDERLRQLGAELHPDAHAEVMLAWARAVNDQKLTIP